MKRHILLFFITFIPLFVSAQENVWFGCNYTLPFAHAYRAEGYLGMNRKAAVDKDTYHFARLGFNAFRVHIWDVEITDSKGNLLENEHLDLLDYLISKLKERGIKIVLTAQTNFGNGYPERNIQTSGYSYLYDKCAIHSDSQAIEAQAHYLSALVQHVNKYTGKAYKDDPSILGFEINNEPCHPGTKDEVKAYIEKMIDAMKLGGNRKPVFYNVSHNRQVVDAYYDTPIEGTTYQWYPIGLVAGRTRTGNFLPYVDEYPIPFSNVKHFNKKMKMVYEFDAADIMYSYMYPAITRTFRTAGFQWITQFTYDPIDIAWANTEYQTHYMNLAYTPHKAISLKIAGEVARNLPSYKSWGTYPNDTIFGDFHVSYANDLSEMNSTTKFFYSNDTKTQPKNPKQLLEIAGCGSSPVVQYEGTGAYFLDRLDKGVWRLEVMPDEVIVNDPFAKPSLRKEVSSIIWNKWNMKVCLSDLGENFSVTPINEGNKDQYSVSNGDIHSLAPGVYLLKNKEDNKWQATSKWKNITLGEYVAPQSHVTQFKVIHTPLVTADENKDMKIKATIIGPTMPDSVLIYTDKISFWSANNPYIKMVRTKGYEYQGTALGSEVKVGNFRYTISVYSGGKCITYPSQTPTTPLDWDYDGSEYYATAIVSDSAPVILSKVTDAYSKMESYVMPDETRGAVSRDFASVAPADEPMLQFNCTGDSASYYLIKDIDKSRIERIKNSHTIALHIGKSSVDTIQVGFVTTDGYTYVASCVVNQGIVKVSLDKLHQIATALLPHAYPVFMKKYFYPTKVLPFKVENIDKIEIIIPKSGQLTLGSIWLE